jgi:hypothetical protein
VYSRLRVPIFLASLLFMLGSLVVMIHGLPPETIAEPAWTETQRTDYNEKRLAYARRLRVDAFEHLDKVRAA